ncbi:unnamed protein product, partial [Dibothriocephalus latus]
MTLITFSACILSELSTNGEAVLVGGGCCTGSSIHRATAVYLEKNINGSSVKSRKGCFRLADPMTLNVFTLLVSSLSLAFVPLAVKDICTSHPKPIKCNCFPPPLGVLYILVILHTAVSGLAISLRSVIAVELISTHHLTAAFAYLLVFQGTGAMCGPPLL